MNKEINEACFGIAKYMGFTIYPEETEIMPQGMSHAKLSWLKYHCSLDALIPVWKKLAKDTEHGIVFCDIFFKSWNGGLYTGWTEGNQVSDDYTMHEKACLITWRLIKKNQKIS